MKNLPLVDLEATRQELGQDLEETVLRVVRSNRFIGGPEIESFESAFAAFTGASHAVGVANGTDAIELALRALGLEPEWLRLKDTGGAPVSFSLSHSGSFAVIAVVDADARIGVDVEVVKHRA